MDIGCGSGNITDRIKDFVPHERTIGIDKSCDMIEYARSNHAGVDVSYITADICSSDQIERLIESEAADIVVSIHCLHWITEADQGKALANIRNLLKPGAVAYLLLFSWSDMLPLQEQLVYHPRWRKYFKAVIEEEEERNANLLNVGKETERRRRRSSAPFPTFDPPPQHERIRQWKQRCSDLFFQDVQVSMHNVTFDFGDWKSFQGMYRMMTGIAVCRILQSD
jgi:SAM-dependent methyltransferase